MKRENNYRLDDGWDRQACSFTLSRVNNLFWLKIIDGRVVALLIVTAWDSRIWILNSGLRTSSSRLSIINNLSSTESLISMLSNDGYGIATQDFSVILIFIQ